jgi:hypothetical protein
MYEKTCVAYMENWGILGCQGIFFCVINNTKTFVQEIGFFPANTVQDSTNRAENVLSLGPNFFYYLIIFIFILFNCKMINILTNLLFLIYGLLI